MSAADPDIIRLHQIGAGVERRIAPDAAGRAAIARTLDLADLDAFTADLALKPVDGGWRLEGRVRAEAVQTCGLTLEPLPVSIDRAFNLKLVEEAEEPDLDGEIVVDLEAEDGPDVVEDGRIDLMQYAIEQLALSLDPFPRKAGAVFVQPEQPPETSPFSVLSALRPRDGEDRG